MNKQLTIACFILNFCLSICYAQERIKLSKSLEIIPLTENVFIHVSYLDVTGYGPFPCNGVIYKNDNEVIIFDTPVNDTLTRELVNWINTALQAEIKGVIINHFHIDCIGGLDVLHQMGIPSYAQSQCLELAKEASGILPETGFHDELELSIGNREISCRYFGEAHSKDNMVCWLPVEKILFGGCMIKAENAGKGNLEDANTNEWASTVEKVKKYYSNAEIVIPGHGNAGGTELFDYTIKLFSK